MRTVTAIDAKDRFGELLDAAQREPVTVTQDGQPAAVMLSIADYDRLRGAARRKLLATLAEAPSRSRRGRLDRGEARPAPRRWALSNSLQRPSDCPAY